MIWAAEAGRTRGRAQKRRVCSRRNDSSAASESIVAEVVLDAIVAVRGVMWFSKLSLFKAVCYVCYRVSIKVGRF